MSAFLLQKFGPILDVEIIFNERGSKVSCACAITRVYGSAGEGDQQRDIMQW
jgi:hypothetical protein